MAAVVVMALVNVGVRAAGFSFKFADIMAVAVIAGFAATAGRVVRGLPAAIPTMVASASIGFVASLSPRVGLEDIAYCLRLGSLPIWFAIGRWILRSGSEARVLRIFRLALIISAALVILNAQIGAALSTDAASSFDSAMSPLFPRNDPGLVYTAGSLVRGRGSFGHPNEAAAVIAVLTCTQLANLRRSRTTGSVWAWASVALGTIAVLLTATRAALAVLGLVAVVLWLVSARARRVLAPLRFLGRVLLLLSLVVLGTRSFVSSSPKASGYGGRIATIANYQSETSYVERLQTWREGLSDMLSHSPFGEGYSTSVRLHGAYHNAWIFIGASVGVLLFVLAVGASIALALKSFRWLSRPGLQRACGAGSLAWLLLGFVEDRPHSSTTMMLLLLLAGCGIEASLRRRSPMAGRDRLSGGGRTSRPATRPTALEPAGGRP